MSWAPGCPARSRNGRPTAPIVIEVSSNLLQPKSSIVVAMACMWLVLSNGSCPRTWYIYPFHLTSTPRIPPLRLPSQNITVCLTYPGPDLEKTEVNANHPEDRRSTNFMLMNAQQGHGVAPNKAVVSRGAYLEPLKIGRHYPFNCTICWVHARHALLK